MTEVPLSWNIGRHNRSERWVFQTASRKMRDASGVAWSLSGRCPAVRPIRWRAGAMQPKLSMGAKPGDLPIK